VADPLGSGLLLVVDLETNGLDPEKGHTPFLIGFQREGEGRTWKFDMRGNAPKADDILGADHPKLREFMNDIEDESVIKVAHNAKFEIRMLRAIYLKPRGPWWCTMNMTVLHDEYSRLSLDWLAQRYFKEEYTEDHLITEWLSQERRARRKHYRNEGWDHDDAPEPTYEDYYAQHPDVMSCYLEKDLDHTLRLALQFRVGCTTKFRTPFETDTALVPFVADMEDNGIYADREFCKLNFKKYSKLARSEKKRIWDIAGETFNLDSPQQLKSIFHRLGYEISDTRKDTLYALEGEFAKALLEYRADSKIARWFRTFLLDSQHDSLIHASFWQNGQDQGIKTGRFSIKDSGLQTIPGGYRGTVGQRGKDVRRAIKPRPGHNLFMADYAQVEPRILAEYTQDERLLTELLAGRDIYLAFVRIFFGKTPFKKGNETLLAQRRSDAKTIILAITYGMGVDKMARNLGVVSSVARGMRAQAMTEMPTMKEFMDDCSRTVARLGYIDDLCSRRYRVPRDRSYKGINAIIQGLAAQVMKRALARVGYLINMWNEMQGQEDSKVRARMLLTVHDEIVFEVPIGQEDELCPLVRLQMESAMPELKVPLVADMSWGPHGASWGDKVDWREGAALEPIAIASKAASADLAGVRGIGNID